MQESMLTIREVLDMPVFSSSRLVAGGAGIDNRIRWVHIVDIPDARYEWQRRGVMLLTAGYGLRDDPRRQAELIPKLVQEGFAGMVLAVGYYFDATPAVMREAAEALNFPIIESPRDILFIEVTEAVLERILNRQNRLLEQASAISAQLTDLVLQGANLEGLASTLAQLIGRSVTIEDATFRVVADAQIGPVDEARRLSVERGRSSPELAQRLLDAGIYAALLDRLEPIALPPMPELGMSMERLVAPIIVDREIYGYIWVLIDPRTSSSQPLSELDTRAIRHAATVAALILFKDRAVRRAEEAQRGNFLDQLLHTPDSAVIFGEQARRLRFQAERPQQVLIAAPELSSGGPPRSILPAVESWLAARGISALVAWRGSHLVMILESQRAGSGPQIAADFFAAHDHPGSRLLVGLGSVCSPEEMRSGGLRRSYDQAHEALHIARATGRGPGVFDFDELGLLHWLYHLPAHATVDTIYLRAIRRLDSYDHERNAELLKTLGIFLENNGSLVETAAQLFIHRNTLLHRLERIRTICRMDMRTAWQRLNLYAALMVFRLTAERRP